MLHPPDMTRPRLHHDHQQLLLSQQQEDLHLARKDALSALMVWILLEGLSLLVLPNFQLIKGETKAWTWFLITIPMGILGSGLIGLSSWLVKRIQEKVDRQDSNKQLFATLSQALGWLGLIGIGFPIIMVGLELWLLLLQGTP
jgi:hypothetical protein